MMLAIIIIPIAVTIILVGIFMCLVFYVLNSYSKNKSEYYLIRIINKNNIKDYIVYSKNRHEELEQLYKNKEFPISVNSEYLEEDEVLEFFPDIANVGYRFSYSLNSWLKNSNTSIISLDKVPGKTIQAARLYYTKNMLPTKNKIKKVIEEN